LERTDIQVLDDGTHVQLTPERRFHGAVADLLQPEQLPRLTQEQAEVLAIVISDGLATRRRIEEVRGAAQLSIGPAGPISLPRDSSETLALLLARGLLAAERDDHAMGRPLVYRPTPRLLQLVGAETLEEARVRLRVPADYRSQAGGRPLRGSRLSNTELVRTERRSESASGPGRGPGRAADHPPRGHSRRVRGPRLPSRELLRGRDAAGRR
jgi:hypothetical protein